MFQSPTYQFRKGWKGGIRLEVSTRLSDWQAGSMQTKSQVESFGKLYIKFARLWLEKRGYYPVEIRLIDHYDQHLGGFGFDPDFQANLRSQIMADMLSPQNWGQPMSSWRGISDNTPNIRPIDYGE